MLYGVMAHEKNESARSKKDDAENGHGTRGVARGL